MRAAGSGLLGGEGALVAAILHNPSTLRVLANAASAALSRTLAEDLNDAHQHAFIAPHPAVR
jgi:hypothetical protein